MRFINKIKYFGVFENQSTSRKVNLNYINRFMSFSICKIS